MINLERYAGRPTLVAVAAMNAITGLAAAAILAPLSFGADVDFLRRGAQGLLDGQTVPDFVFTPLCAAVAIPLAVMPATWAAVVMTSVGLVIVLSGVSRETQGWPLADRALVSIAVLGALPVVNELLLGQVTLLIAATVYPFRDHDTPARGVAFGIALALVPKPLVVPLLAWMLLRRRRALVAALVTAVVLTALGLLVLGMGTYADWITALGGAGRVTRHGSFSIWTDGITPLAVVLAAVIVGALIWSLADERRGFVAALLAGLLLAPYTLLYAVSILTLAIRPAFGFAPRATRALALVGNPAALVAPTAFLGAIFGVSVWHGRREPLPVDGPES